MRVNAENYVRVTEVFVARAVCESLEAYNGKKSTMHDYANQIILSLLFRWILMHADKLQLKQEGGDGPVSDELTS